MKIVSLAVAAAAAALFATDANAQSGALENPQQNGIESGIGVISGWHCTGRVIEIRIDGVSLGLAGAGTSRGDTQGVCGRSDTGFSLLFNYNLLSPGTHRIEAWTGGAAFGTATFTVGTLGGEFLTGLSRPISVGDFPARGTTANLRWLQGKQNFVIESSAPTNALPIAGNYVLTQFFVLYADGLVLSSATPGVSGKGSMVIRTDGAMTQAVELTINGNTVTSGGGGAASDRGHYLSVSSGGQSYNLGILSRGNVLTTQILNATGATPFTEIDVWSRVLGGGNAAANAVGPTDEIADAPPGALLGRLPGARSAQ